MTYSNSYLDIYVDRAALWDERKRLKVLRDHGLLDPNYPRGHFVSIVETMTQVFPVRTALVCSAYICIELVI